MQSIRTAKLLAQHTRSAMLPRRALSGPSVSSVLAQASASLPAADRSGQHKPQPILSAETAPRPLNYKPRLPRRDYVVKSQTRRGFQQLLTRLRREHFSGGERATASPMLAKLLKRESDPTPNELLALELPVLTELLHLSVLQMLPAAAVHLVYSLPWGVQLGPDLTQDVLQAVKGQGRPRDLMLLRQSLQPRVAAPLDAAAATERGAPTAPASYRPPLVLSEADVERCVAHCVQAGELDEALQWLLTADAALGLAPTEASCSLLLTALAARPQWDPLHFLLSEMRRMRIVPSARSYEALLRGADKVPELRWRHSQQWLLELVNHHVLDSTALAAATLPAGTRGALRTVGVALRTLLQADQLGAFLRAWVWLQESLPAGGALLQAVGEATVLDAAAAASKHGHASLMEALLLAEIQAITGADVDTGTDSDGDNNGAGVSVERAAAASCAAVEAALRARLHLGLGSEALNGAALGYLLLHADGDSDYFVSQWLPLYEAAVAAGVDRGADRAVEICLLEHAARAVAGAVGGAAVPPQERVLGFASLLRNVLESEPVQVQGGASAIEEQQLLLLPSAALVNYAVSLFAHTGPDASGMASALLHAEAHGLVLTEPAFLLAAQVMLRRGDTSLVLGLLESYLAKRLEHRAAAAAEAGGTPPAPAPGLGGALFRPAMEALALHGELPLLVALLLKEVPEKGRWPRDSAFLLAMSALSAAGKPTEAVDLFFLCVSRGRDSEAGSTSNVPYHQKLNSVLVSAALRACADGGLGHQALQILSLSEESGLRYNLAQTPQGTRYSPDGKGDSEPPRLCVSLSAIEGAGSLFARAGDAVRDVDNVVRALASPTFIDALPNFLAIVRAGRQRPVAITPALHRTCLAAALHAQHAPTVLHFLEHGPDEPLPAGTSARQQVEAALVVAEGLHGASAADEGDRVAFLQSLGLGF